MTGRKYIASFIARAEGVKRVKLHLVAGTDAAAVQHAVIYATKMNQSDVPKLLFVYEADDDWNEVREVVTCFG